MRIQLLGQFTIEYKGKRLENSRANKSVMLLAYFIFNRSRRISHKELYTLLWEDGGDSDDPENALKVAIHRVRTLLNKLDPSAGRSVLLTGKSGDRNLGKDFLWNPEIGVALDIDEFTALSRPAEGEPAERLEQLQRAVALYQGELLPSLSSERWVMPLSTHYHDLYCKTVESALALLKEQGKLEEIVTLCRTGLRHEPYSEAFYRYMLRALVDSGNPQRALVAYEDYRNRHFEFFGELPPKSIRELGREAAQQINQQALTPDHLRDQIREMQLPSGAMICDYDFFCLLYHSHARSISRTGEPVYIGLLTVQSKSGKMLQRKALDNAVDRLLSVISDTLRSGDAATRCSVSQVMVMLPMANLENSKRICERICEGFCRSNPHSPVHISFVIQPIDMLDRKA